MALRVTGWRVLWLADLWIAAEDGLPVILHPYLGVFEEHLLVRQFENKARILTQRYGLTPIGLKYAQMLFERKCADGRNRED